MKASRNLLQRNDVRYDDLTSTNAVTGISTDCVASATGVESWETRRELEAGMARKKVTWAILSKHDGCNSAQSKILQWKQGITARSLQAAAGIIFLLTVLWWHRLSTEASASELCSNRERTLFFFFFPGNWLFYLYRYSCRVIFKMVHRSVEIFSVKSPASCFAKMQRMILVMEVQLEREIWSCLRKYCKNKQNPSTFCKKRTNYECGREAWRSNASYMLTWFCERWQKLRNRSDDSYIF